MIDQTEWPGLKESLERIDIFLQELRAKDGKGAATADVQDRIVLVSVPRNLAVFLDEPGEVVVRLRILYAEGDARRESDRFPGQLEFRGQMGGGW